MSKISGDKFGINLAQIDQVLSKRSYKLTPEIKEKLVKVAFDVVKFKDGNPEELWRIESSDEGDYIVAIYDEDKIVSTASKKTPWTIQVKNADLHVFYKGDHLCRIAATDLGIPVHELPLVSHYLPSKLADNKNLVSSMLKLLDQDTKSQIARKYPEFA